MQTFRQDRAEMVSELRRMTRLTFEIVSGFVCGLMTRTQFGHGGSLRALFGQMVCATFIGGREESIYDTPKAWFLKMLTKLRYHVFKNADQAPLPCKKLDTPDRAVLDGPSPFRRQAQAV